MAIHHIRENDTEPDFRTRLTDADGLPVDLSGATVRFHCIEAHNPNTVIIDGLATPDADQVNNRGWVNYVFNPGDTATPGRHWAEWEVTYPSGGVQTFPTRGHDVLLVHGELL